MEFTGESNLTESNRIAALRAACFKYFFLLISLIICHLSHVYIMSDAQHFS